MKDATPTVTVFGSALAQPGDEAYALAMDLGRRLATSGFRLCNGGYGGTMEAAARGAREALGAPAGTVGVTCELFHQRRANPWIDDVHPSRTLFERIEHLVALGDAFIILPGGTGTLLELAAVLELTAKGLVAPRPIILLGDYWRTVVDLTLGETSMSRGTRPAVVSTVEECVAALTTFLRGDRR